MIPAKLRDNIFFLGFLTESASEQFERFLALANRKQIRAIKEIIRNLVKGNIQLPSEEVENLKHLRKIILKIDHLTRLHSVKRFLLSHWLAVKQIFSYISVMTLLQS